MKPKTLAQQRKQSLTPESPIGWPCVYSPRDWCSHLKWTCETWIHTWDLMGFPQRWRIFQPLFQIALSPLGCHAVYETQRDTVTTPPLPSLTWYYHNTIPMPQAACLEGCYANSFSDGIIKKTHVLRTSTDLLHGSPPESPVSPRLHAEADPHGPESKALCSQLLPAGFWQSKVPRDMGGGACIACPLTRHSGISRHRRPLSRPLPWVAPLSPSAPIWPSVPSPVLRAWAWQRLTLALSPGFCWVPLPSPSPISSTVRFLSLLLRGPSFSSGNPK